MQDQVGEMATFPGVGKAECDGCRRPEKGSVFCGNKSLLKPEAIALCEEASHSTTLKHLLIRQTFGCDK